MYLLGSKMEHGAPSQAALQPVAHPLTPGFDWDCLVFQPGGGASHAAAFYPHAHAHASSPEITIADAEQFYNEGKLTESIEAYKHAILADPNNPSCVTLARIQVFAGDYKDAITNSQNALLKNPNNPLAHAVQGWALGFTRDYLAAEGGDRQALELDANNALTHAYYAEVLLNTGDWRISTRRPLSRARAKELDPGLLEVHPLVWCWSAPAPRTWERPSMSSKLPSPSTIRSPTCT